MPLNEWIVGHFLLKNVMIPNDLVFLAQNLLMLIQIEYLK